MVSKSTYISQRVWRSIDPSLRRAIFRATGLKRKDIVSNTMFIATLESRLRERNENELADMLLKQELH